MAYKNVTSKDPRKPEVAAALKRASGARAVTMVRHDTTRGVFLGHCLNKGRGLVARSFGWHGVDADTLEAVGAWPSFAAYRTDMEGR